MTDGAARTGGWRRWMKGPRGWALGAAALAGLVFGVGWWELGRWRDGLRLQRLRGEVQLTLSARSQALAAAVARRLTLLDGAHAFVELEISSGDIGRAFPEFASRLQRVVPGVRNLGVARGSTYVLVSPVEGNERILGYDPLADPRPEVRADAKRVLEGETSVVSGPLDLVQGGVGLIARRAVRRDGRVWGFVAVVVDLQPIVDEALLDGVVGGLSVAVRQQGQRAFLGVDETFRGDPVTLAVNLPTVPDLRWQIAGRPAGGWDRGLAEGRRLWMASGLVLGLIPIALVFGVTWRLRVRTESHQDTERLVSERTAALARTSVIVENSPVVLVRWLPGEGWPVEFVSDNIAQFGYSADDFHSGRLRWADILAAEDRVRMDEETARDREAGVERTRQEYRILTADGRVRWMEDRTTIVDLGDGIRRHQGIVIDITERKQREEAQRDAEHRLRELESQYRQSQKMEAVGQLAGGIAHDFNNLLQVIAGYADLVLEDLPTGAALYSEISEIKRASDRATSLVRQLLAFSRRQTMERRQVEPNFAVGHLLKMLHRVIGEHIELDFRPGDDLPGVLADPVQIEQVLVNLCVNARDAMPGGGRLTISTRREVVGIEFCERHPWARAGEFVVVEVADTGPGIPPEILDRIFEPFFTTKEVGKGTGLGLATVYGIVKQHEGMIDVSVPSDGGTVFRIFLPATSEERRADDAADPAALARTGHETILLAEDEELVRTLALRVLEQGGYRVLVARDGAEAIALVESRGAEIDLALLDVVMPKANGPQVRARIREIQPGMAVLFCSGYSRQVLPENVVPEDDSIELLLKPYAPRVLLDRVRAALARRADGRRQLRSASTVGE